MQPAPWRLFVVAISLSVIISAIANRRARFSAVYREHARNISRQLSQLRQLATSISIRAKPVGAEASWFGDAERIGRKMASWPLWPMHRDVARGLAEESERPLSSDISHARRVRRPNEDQQQQA